MWKDGPLIVGFLNLCSNIDHRLLYLKSDTCNSSYNEHNSSRLLPLKKKMLNDQTTHLIPHYLMVLWTSWDSEDNGMGSK